MTSDKILIVEDEDQVAKLLRNALKDLGYSSISHAANGEDAIRKAIEFEPDLVLMDIMLEGDMDGVEAADQIRAHLDVPVVFLTAYASEDLLKRAKVTGPYGYLVKPCQQRDLHATIEMAMYKHAIDTRLKASEARYRAVVECQTELICRCLPDGTISFVNEAFCRHFDVQCSDAVGRRISAHFPEALRDEAAKRMWFLVREDSDLTTDPLVAGDRKGRWLEWRMRRIISAQGRLSEFQLVARDITDRKRAEEAVQKAHDELEFRVLERTAELSVSNYKFKEANRLLQFEIEERRKKELELRISEERFRAIFESSPDCIFIKDRDLRYVHVNPAMEHLAGVAASRLIGTVEEKVFGSETAKLFSEMDRRALEGEVVEFEHTRIVGGVPNLFYESRMPLRIEEDEVMGICGIARNVTERTEPKRPREIVTLESYRSKAMLGALEQALQVAGTESTVLLTGESGSGKDHLAKFIHEHSSRRGGPYFTINCAAVASELAEGELLGHEKGAFTGAHGRKRGLLELAEGGTLLLNEIGELPLQLQAKLLVFLDTRRITRVGGEKEVKVNARIIAATNRDLDAEVSRGGFRSDLFYRLNAFCIRVPPLRERVEDLPSLINQTLEALAGEHKLAHIPKIDPGTMERLQSYGWPGNVRELKNVLQRAVILFQGGPFKVPFLERVPEPESSSEHSEFRPGKSLKEASHEFKVNLVKQALEHCKGNKTKTAALLGISRMALMGYLK